MWRERVFPLDAEQARNVACLWCFFAGGRVWRRSFAGVEVGEDELRDGWPGVWPDDDVGAFFDGWEGIVDGHGEVCGLRSEERRVGKECRL